MLARLVPTVFAQNECAPGSGGVNIADCLKLSDDQTVSSVYNSPAFLVNLIVRNLFVLAGIILFAMILVSGFKFLQQDKKGIDEAKSIMTSALVGFLIMFAAYWIVQIVALVTGADIQL